MARILQHPLPVRRAGGSLGQPPRPSWSAGSRSSPSQLPPLGSPCLLLPAEALPHATATASPGRWGLGPVRRLAAVGITKNLAESRRIVREFPAGRGSWESAMQPAGRCGFGGPAGLGSQVSPPASPCLPVGWEGQLSFPGLCSAWDWGPFMSGCRQGRTGYPELKPSGTPGLGHSSGI